MSLIICGQCRGEGTAWDDRNGWFDVCPTCGGDGNVDEYQEDEFYPDYEDEGRWAQDPNWCVGCNPDNCSGCPTAEIVPVRFTLLQWLSPRRIIQSLRWRWLYWRNPNYIPF